MQKNRETYAKLYPNEIKWLKENLQTLTETKNKFMIDMYTVLITGSRKITPKMATSIANGIDRCKSNPHFNEDVRETEEIIDELKSSDYEHLILTFDKYFGKLVDLER